MFRPLRQSLLKRREHQQKQRGQRHRPRPAPTPQSQAARQGRRFFRRGQMRFEDGPGGGRQPDPAPVNQIARLPAGRKLRFERVQPLKIVNAAQTGIQKAADKRRRRGFARLIGPGQRGQPQAQKRRAFARKPLRGGDDQKIHDPVQGIGPAAHQIQCPAALCLLRAEDGNKRHERQHLPGLGVAGGKRAAFAEQGAAGVKSAHRERRFLRPVRPPPAVGDGGHFRRDRFARQPIRPIVFQNDARFFHSPQVVPQVLEALPGQREFGQLNLRVFAHFDSAQPGGLIGIQTVRRHLIPCG